MDLKAMGTRLARLRESRGMAAAALAEKVGISRGYLSRVENGRQVPSIVTLDAIAQIFGVELDYFFSSSGGAQVIVHRNAAEAAGAIPPKATFAYEALCRERAHKLAQPFIALFRPHTRTRVVAHRAEYFRYVLEGRMRFHYDGDCHDVSAGDAIYYDATSPHEIECVGEAICKAVTLYMKPPDIGFPVPASIPEGHL